LDGREAWYSNSTNEFSYGPFSNEYIQQNNLQGASFADNGMMAVDLPQATVMSSNVANAGMGQPAWEGNVVEYKTPTSMKFVRAYTEGASNPNGDWMMRAEDIKGLSDVEIQNKFAMPNKPTNMVDVDVPAGTTIREGMAAGNKWGKGGGTQFHLQDRISSTNYTNSRVMPIRQTSWGITEEDVEPGCRTGTGRTPISPEAPIGEEPMEISPCETPEGVIPP
jgi:hypothetical protein